MAAPEILRKLVHDQRTHDERAHRDIYYLSYRERLTHLVLHYAKYVGRLADPATRDREIRRTVTDTFIITLSACELLRLDLAAALTQPGRPHASDLARLGTQGFDNNPPTGKHGEWFLTGLARHTGTCAKCLEALDHLEALDFRPRLEQAVIGVSKLCIVTSALEGVNLEQAVKTRWTEIEQSAFGRGLE